jgi:hypothetical protein
MQRHRTVAKAGRSFRHGELQPAFEFHHRAVVSGTASRRSYSVTDVKWTFYLSESPFDTEHYASVLRFTRTHSAMRDSDRSVGVDPSIARRTTGSRSRILVVPELFARRLASSA